MGSNLKFFHILEYLKIFHIFHISEKFFHIFEYFVSLSIIEGKFGRD